MLCGMTGTGHHLRVIVGPHRRCPGPAERATRPSAGEYAAPQPAARAVPHVNGRAATSPICAPCASVSEERRVGRVGAPFRTLDGAQTSSSRATCASKRGEAQGKPAFGGPGTPNGPEPSPSRAPREQPGAERRVGRVAAHRRTPGRSSRRTVGRWSETEAGSGTSRGQDGTASSVTTPPALPVSRGGRPRPGAGGSPSPGPSADRSASPCRPASAR